MTYRIGFLFLIILSTCNHKNKVANEDKQQISQEAPIAISLLRDSVTFYYNNDEWLDAIRLYSILIIKDPINKGEYFYKKAYCLALIDDLNKSTENYKSAVREEYEVSDANFSIGLNYAILKQDSLAIIFYEKALYQLDSINNLNGLGNNTEDRQDILDNIKDSKNKLRTPVFEL